MATPFTVYKLIILYMLRNSSTPVTNSEISQFILDHSNLCSFHIFQKIPEDRRLAGSQKSRQKIQFNLTHDSFLLFLYCNCTLICSAAAATYFSSFSVLQLQFKSPA